MKLQLPTKCTAGMADFDKMATALGMLYSGGVLYTWWDNHDSVCIAGGNGMLLFVLLLLLLAPSGPCSAPPGVHGGSVRGQALQPQHGGQAHGGGLLVRHSRQLAAGMAVQCTPPMHCITPTGCLHWVAACLASCMLVNGTAHLLLQPYTAAEGLYTFLLSPQVPVSISCVAFLPTAGRPGPPCVLQLLGHLQHVCTGEASSSRTPCRSLLHKHDV